MQLPPVSFGQAFTGFQTQKPRFQNFSAPPSGGDSVHFGHGNPKQHESVVRSSVEAEARRLDKCGRLPEGMSREEFVEQKMAERAKRKKRRK